MELEIRSLLEKTTRFKRSLGALVTAHEYPTDPKRQLLLAYHSIMSEHHEAICLLIKNGLDGSAFALVRSFYEPFYRAHWIVGCASPKQIDELLHGKDIFPKMHEMVEQIDSAFGIDDFFQNIKKSSWGSMNDYTHSGLRQIGRRFRGNLVEPNYATDEIVEVLDGINIGLLLMGLLFFKVFDRSEAATKVEKLITEYTAVPGESA